MINGKKVLGLVTARAGSKGLPGKNIKPMLGKPLIAWTIEQGLASRYIDKILVSTDGQEIAQVARDYKADVPFIRPHELATDSAKSIEVIEHALEFLAAADHRFDMIVLLEPTSPLRDVSDIDGAVEFCDSLGDSASVVSVVVAESSHPAFLFKKEDAYIRPMLDRAPNGLRRQDLQDEYYYLEGSVYVSPIPLLKTKAGFYHDCTAPWIVERYKSVEIDEMVDFITAEALLAAKLKGLIS